MKRLGVSLLAVVGLLLVSAFAAANASAAEPSFLSSAAFPISGTSESGVGRLTILESSTFIECRRDTDKILITSATTVVTTIDFNECTGKIGEASVGKCGSLGDELGLILVFLDGKLVYDNVRSGELGAGILFTILPTTGLHIECLASLILIKGQYLCLITPINESRTTSTLKCEQKEGMPKEKAYFETSEGREKTAEALLSSTNGATAKESGEETSDTNTFGTAVEIMA
jgi:hypothetical protein